MNVVFFIEYWISGESLTRPRGKETKNKRKLQGTNVKRLQIASRWSVPKERKGSVLLLQPQHDSFFRRLWDIVPVQTCVFKNQFDGTNESTDFQSHKSKKRRRLKIDSQHLSRQLKKTKIRTLLKQKTRHLHIYFGLNYLQHWLLAMWKKSILQTDNMLARFQKRCRKLQLQITMLLALAEYRGGR